MNDKAHIAFSCLTWVLVASTAACSAVSTPAALPPTIAAPTAAPPTVAPTVAPIAPATESPAPTAAAAVADENKLEDLALAKFDNPTEIDSDWMPLKPGMRYVYEGTTTADDGTLVPHRIEIHVTDLVKEIGGVPSLATWDLDFSNNVLAEAELAFFAQDNDGNVWRMGEYPEVYEGGKLVEAPSWIHGLQDARAGIMMPANPKVGTPSYSQGWGPAVNWTDRGRIDQMEQKTCVPLKCFDDVLIVAETSRSEPGAEQLKFWAKGVGNVRVGWRGDGEKTKEVLELVKLEQLEGKAFDDVRAAALKLEQSAYANSKEVYAKTPALKLLSGEALPAMAATEVVVQSPTQAPAAADVIEIKVSISEFKIEMDKTSVPVGRVRFVIENVGKEEHDFLIEEIGGKDEPLSANGASAIEGDIFAGKKTSLEWTFDKAGKFQIACHNDTGGKNHFDSGMNVEFTVTEK